MKKIKKQIKTLIKGKTITKMRFKVTYHMVNQTRKKFTMRLKKMFKIKDQNMDL